ncbi:hypothetical protein J6TS7_31620 [Paenibacillus dendritiformis]|nr:hypothetical protein J6TS7_31620 [Paenibacillus dendritiformis]
MGVIPKMNTQSKQFLSHFVGNGYVRPILVEYGFQNLFSVAYPTNLGAGSRESFRLLLMLPKLLLVLFDFEPDFYQYHRPT